MLDKALEKKLADGKLILHLDQGQYYCYQRKLQDDGIVRSVSSKGNCLDNVMMEDFFGIMKT